MLKIHFRKALSVGLGLGAFSVCGCGEEPSSDNEAQYCQDHEMRPNRYRLFEIVDVLKGLSVDEDDPSDHEVYVIPGHWSAFWEVPLVGFDAAQEEMGFSGSFEAACNKEDTTCVEDQMALFEELTDGETENGNASAIGLSCKDGVAMAPLVSAVSDDVPIITFDSDVTDPTQTGRHLYLGAINKPAGREAGRRVFNLFPEAGEVHLYAQSFAATNLMERAAGVFELCLDTTFADAADFAESEYCENLETLHICEATCTDDLVEYRVVAHAYGGELEADSDYGGNHEEATPEDYLAYSVERLVRSDTPPSAIISLHGTPSDVLNGVLSEHDDDHEIRFMAWDLSEPIQAGLENATVDATMVQNAYFYGYITAHIAYAMSVTDPETVMDALEAFFEPDSDDKLIDTGMTVITPETLPIFLDYQRECLGVSGG